MAIDRWTVKGPYAKIQAMKKDHLNVAASPEVWRAMASVLTPREEQVFRLLYLEGMTLEEVSQRFAVTRERIRQIAIKAKAKIEKHLGTFELRFDFGISDVKAYKNGDQIGLFRCQCSFFRYAKSGRFEVELWCGKHQGAFMPSPEEVGLISTGCLHGAGDSEPLLTQALKKLAVAVKLQGQRWRYSPQVEGEWPRQAPVQQVRNAAWRIQNNGRLRR